MSRGLETYSGRHNRSPSLDVHVQSRLAGRLDDPLQDLDEPVLPPSLEDTDALPAARALQGVGVGPALGGQASHYHLVGAEVAGDQDSRYDEGGAKIMQLDRLVGKLRLDIEDFQGMKCQPFEQYRIEASPCNIEASLIVGVQVLV